MTDNNIGKSAKKGIAWTASAQVIKQCLEFGVGVIMARLLAPSDFGVVAACMIFFSFVSIVTSFGFGPAIIQRSEINDEYLNTAQTICVAFGIVSSLAMALCAGLIGGVFRNQAVSDIIPLMSLTFLFSSFSIVPQSLLTRQLCFSKLTTASIISSASYGVVAVGMAASGFGVWSLVGAPVASVFVNMVLLSYFASYFPKFSFNRKYCNEIWSFGGAVTISSLLNHVARNADNFIVGRHLGSEALGFYSRAYNLATIPKEIMVSVFGAVLFPSFARMQDSVTRQSDAYFKSINAIVLVTLPASLVLLISAPELINVVYGDKWSNSIFPLRILSLAGFVYTLYIPCTSLLLGLGKVRPYTILQIVYSVGTILAVCLTYSQGIACVAFAVSMVIIISWIAYLVAVHKIFAFQFSSYWKSSKVALFGALYMSLAMLVTKYMLNIYFNNMYLVLFAELLAAAAAYMFYLLKSQDEVCIELKNLICGKLGFKNI